MDHSQGNKTNDDSTMSHPGIYARNGVIVRPVRRLPQKTDTLCGIRFAAGHWREIEVSMVAL